MCFLKLKLSCGSKLKLLRKTLLDFSKTLILSDLTSVKIDIKVEAMRIVAKNTSKYQLTGKASINVDGHTICKGDIISGEEYDNLPGRVKLFFAKVAEVKSETADGKSESDANAEHLRDKALICAAYATDNKKDVKKLRKADIEKAFEQYQVETGEDGQPVAVKIATESAEEGEA